MLKKIMYTHMMIHGEQNRTLTSKVKGQVHSADAINNDISQTVDFDMFTHTINHGN